MIYAVCETTNKLGVLASTLRCYDKEGLLPFVERSSGASECPRKATLSGCRSSAA